MGQQPGQPGIWLHQNPRSGYRFASAEQLYALKFDEPFLRATLLETYQPNHIELFLTGDGRRSLRVLDHIPTFDYSDRLYDSWHALYLIESGVPGRVDAFYCTGGYELAQVTGYKDLREAPEKIRELLSKAGIAWACAERTS